MRKGVPNGGQVWRALRVRPRISVRSWALVATTALILVAAVVAPAAHAATVAVGYQSEEGFNNVFVSFRAAPGERNRVAVTTGAASGATQAVTFSDSGAPVRAGRGCLQAGPNTVTCRTERINGDHWVSVGAGNGDDRIDARALRLPGFQTALAGEDGADTVLGSKALVNAIGGDVDPLEGVGSAARGADFLVGGDQNDLIDGGPGRDRIDGAAGDDEIQGKAGDDTLIGGPGRDRLFGGLGSDRLSGGSGNDQVSCGSGRDRARVLEKDRLRGCEWVRRAR